MVFVDGIRWPASEYTIVGTTLTLTSNVAGDSIEIVKINAGSSNYSGAPHWFLVADQNGVSGGMFDFSGFDLTAYDEIEIELKDLTFSATGRPHFAFKVNNAIPATHWAYSRTGAGSSSTETYSVESSSDVALLDTTSTNWGTVDTTTDSAVSYNGRIKILNPQSSGYKSFTFDGISPRGASNTMLWTQGGGTLRSTPDGINGLRVTAGVGTLSGGRVRVWGFKRAANAGAGVVFPTNPSVGDKFYRTDRVIEYYWNGLYWVSTQLYRLDFGTWSATADVIEFRAVPYRGTYSVWLEKMECSRFISTAAQWDVLLRYRTAAANTDVTIASIDGTGFAAAAWGSGSVDIMALAPSDAEVLVGYLDEVTGTATFSGSMTLYYRLAG
jgi:hypothetical protein